MFQGMREGQEPKVPKAQQKAMGSRWSNFLSMNLGVLIVALGIHFFKFPNHFAMGGVAGIAVVLGELLPNLSPAMVSGIINVLLLILGWIVIGKNFGAKTTYCTLLLSALQLLLERWIPMTGTLTDETLLELLFAIICSALGSALLFNQNASTGGTDIIAMIVKSHSSLDIGKALLVVDMVIGASTFFIFDVKTGLFSIAGILLKGPIVDGLIESFNRVKYFTIVSSHPDEIEHYITIDLHRGCTRLVGEGVYSQEDCAVLLCVVNCYQAVLLRNKIKEADPKAFIMVTNTSEIIGRGFRSSF